MGKYKIILLLIIGVIGLIAIDNIFFIPNIKTDNKIINNIENNTLIENEIVTTIVTETKEETETTVYTSAVVNMRNEPVISDNVAAVLPKNTEVAKVDEENGWTKIKKEDNYYFIKSDYISEMQDTEIELLGYYKLTAYCGCSICCGPWGNTTASGTIPEEGRTIAADPSIPFGTKLKIKDTIYTVEDRGGAIKGNKIDIYFNLHSDALQFGVKNNVPVYKVK